MKLFIFRIFVLVFLISPISVKGSGIFRFKGEKVNQDTTMKRITSVALNATDRRSTSIPMNLLAKRSKL
jgi:hypothetical protein